MTRYYTDDIYQRSEKQRKKYFFIYLVCLFVFLAFSVAMIIWYRQLPYRSPKIATVKWVHYPVTVLFVIFSFVYLEIPYKRVRKFCKLCVNIKTGIKETFEGSFLERDNSLVSKDGVDCKSLVFIEWNKYKKVYFERKVYVFYELPYPEIPEKAIVRYVTQGNVLYEYEILQTEEEQQ